MVERELPVDVVNGEWWIVGSASLQRKLEEVALAYTTHAEHMLGSPRYGKRSVGRSVPCRLYGASSVHPASVIREMLDAQF
jgi:hypothetical protein